MLGTLGMLLEGLHVRLQPHQGELQRGGDVGLPAPAVDGDPVGVDLADGGHGAQEVDHGLVVEADQEQLEVGAVRPFRPRDWHSMSISRIPWVVAWAFSPAIEPHCPPARTPTVAAIAAPP